MSVTIKEIIERDLNESHTFEKMKNNFIDYLEDKKRDLEEENEEIRINDKAIEELTSKIEKAKRAYLTWYSNAMFDYIIDGTNEQDTFNFLDHNIMYIEEDIDLFEHLEDNILDVKEDEMEGDNK